MIKEAVFTSVWDGGFKVTSPCKVDTKTKEVFDIEMVDCDGLDMLDRQYVTFDGKSYDVFDDDSFLDYMYDDN